jgi:ectoine hydroxylase-related dioxygenase (phytanoyl-CoA dioxygenase family)
VPVLTEAQKDQFRSDGYLVVKNAVDPTTLASLQERFNTWVEESREYTAPYGSTLDGRARFDVEAGHTAEKPGLRRVSAPVDISDTYFNAMASSRMTDCVAELIGPNVKFHHAKINSKLPGSATAVKWHQDFPFTPHSNDDVITALLMVDEVTPENGPLEVVPGSHRGELHSLWHDGQFTGSIDDSVASECQQNAVRCVGPAGSVCLMHTRLLHGSAPNLSSDCRTLFICVYSADDALPLVPSPVPTEHEGLVVRGVSSNRVRAIPFDMALPQKPSTASFFDQQAKHGVG